MGCPPRSSVGLGYGSSPTLPPGRCTRKVPSGHGGIIVQPLNARATLHHAPDRCATLGRRQSSKGHRPPSDCSLAGIRPAPGLFDGLGPGDGSARAAPRDEIGTFTTGFGVFMNSRIFVQRCSGVEAGISGIIDELGERIRKDYGAVLDTPALHDIIRHGSFRYRGKIQDASQMISESSARTARTIIAELRRVWPSADTMDIFIAGGGAPVLASAIRNEVPHAKVSEEPFWAVVGGLGVYAVQAFKSSGDR